MCQEKAMSQPINRYKADIRDFQFLLFEQFKLEELLAQDLYKDWDVDQCKMVLDESYRFVKDVLGPLNSVGDREGCKVENGRVKTPTGFKAAWKALYEAGWKGIGSPPDEGGQGAPLPLQTVVEELLAGANTAFSMYPGLTHAAADVIAHCATDAQKRKYSDKMFAGEWGGTMCLTEPHAGSDVGASTSTAKRNGDGTYQIRGTKIFISGGDHDLASNVVHLVLARIEGARAGTKGLSLFIVPRVRVAESGGLGEDNDVQVASIEHKMGINGSATCVLNFGENDGCVGELVGTVEHQGMAQMFLMMNAARIGVGLQGLANGAAAYLWAADYAKERKQGPSAKNFKDPEAPKVPIIEHADIRRMLLEMKARVDGTRALAIKLTHHRDWARTLAGKDDAKAGYHNGQVELLVPLVKSYGSDMGYEVASMAIQVMGGAGFLKDHPVEQYARDSRIFAIYEGTNHIQALDLVGRKLGQNGGANTRAYLGDVQAFVAKHKDHPVLASAVARLAKAQEAVAGTSMKFMMWAAQGKAEHVPLAANRFLTMMSETTLGWLLLEQAIIALEKLPTASNADKAFYEGKRYAAQYFAHNLLPNVLNHATIINSEDASALEIPEEALGAQ
jgi:alkylation response protein AidB-like acyl-CoA dehydrogenase